MNYEKMDLSKIFPQHTLIKKVPAIAGWNIGSLHWDEQILKWEKTMKHQQKFL